MITPQIQAAFDRQNGFTGDQITDQAIRRNRELGDQLERDLAGDPAVATTYAEFVAATTAASGARQEFQRAQLRLDQHLARVGMGDVATRARESGRLRDELAEYQAQDAHAQQAQRAAAQRYQRALADAAQHRVATIEAETRRLEAAAPARRDAADRRWQQERAAIDQEISALQRKAADLAQAVQELRRQGQL